MAFGSFDSGVTRPMADINTTPLVDVMLVLLIIFLVTAPLMTQTVRVDLPQASAQAAEIKPETVRLTLDGAGVLHWNEEALASADLPALKMVAAKLAAALHHNPNLEVQLAADRDARYQRVAELMATVKAAGVVRLGFVTTPGSGI